MRSFEHTLVAFFSALLTTFFLAEDESDKMNNVDFGFDKMIGYIIIYQDNLSIGRII